MKSTKIHSSLQTLTHNLTPPFLQKLPLNISIIPVVSKFYPNLSFPIYIPLETHQPVKRRDRRWDDHSTLPTILPLVILTPSKTSSFHPLHPRSGISCLPIFLLPWHFQKASQAPFVLWCIPWFHCTNHQNWEYHVVHLTRSSPAPTISSLLRSCPGLVT